MSVRVRFAPSPTGYLHMGGVRTALFNFLYARRHQGTFVLRIEDTDLERSKPEYTDAILDAMTWLGMAPDEGPYFQSRRTEIYQEAALRLLAEDRAYKCFCTPEELEADREEAMRTGRKNMYSRIWRDRDDHPQDMPWVLRIKAPLEGALTIEDLVQGEVTVDAQELDDFIILRSDGSPTYNFVVVVDDALMQITHVIRGKDHLNNTFRQLPVYHALGFEPPRFAHLPLIDGLSKRKGSLSVQAYRDNGYLAEAVVNYVSRLGWSHGDQEIFTMEELIAYFGFDHVGRSSGSFDDQKFEWVNGEWMKRLDPAQLAQRWVPFLHKAGFSDVVADERLTGIAALMNERARTLVEMTEATGYFFTAPEAVGRDEKGEEKWFKPAVLPAFQEILAALESAPQWERQALEAIYHGVGERHGLGLGKIAQPTRLAITGGTVSPGLFETMELMGQERVVVRMRMALARLQAVASAG